jgi:hypothetical protein
VPFDQTISSRDAQVALKASAFPRSTSAKLSRRMACDAHAYWVQALSDSAKLRTQFGESAQQTVQ